MFYSNGETMFDDPSFFDNYDEKFPIGMKRKIFFYEIPQWEHLKISHLLYSMHIFKNVSSYLLGHMSFKESDTLILRRYHISSKTKNKHWRRQ